MSNRQHGFPAMNRTLDASRALAFYAVIVVLATVMALGSMHLVAIGAPFDRGSPPDMIAGWLAFIALSPLLWTAGGSKLSGRGWRRQIPLSIAVSLFVAVAAEASGTLAAWFTADRRLMVEDLGLLTLDDGMRIKFITSFAIIQIVQGLALRVQKLEQEQRAAVLETQLAATRLSALRMQMHPHFLFNTLNSVTALLRKDPDGARRMLEQLSVLFEKSLAVEGDEKVPLREEVALLLNYLAIEKTRFGDRLKTVIDLDHDVSEALVPSLILQPLVENSIRHGLAPRAAGGTVVIRAFRSRESLTILVSDDGSGLPAGGIREGIGLRNSRVRLEYHYGDRQGLTVEPGSSAGVTVKLVVPLELRQVMESAA